MINEIFCQHKKQIHHRFHLSAVGDDAVQLSYLLDFAEFQDFTQLREKMSGWFQTLQETTKYFVDFFFQFKQCAASFCSFTCSVYHFQLEG